MGAPSVQSLRSSGCLYLEQVGKCAKGKLVMERDGRMREGRRLEKKGNPASPPGTPSSYGAGSRGWRAPSGQLKCSFIRGKGGSGLPHISLMAFLESLTMPQALL